MKTVETGNTCSTRSNKKCVNISGMVNAKVLAGIEKMICCCEVVIRKVRPPVSVSDRICMSRAIQMSQQTPVHQKNVIPVQPVQVKSARFLPHVSLTCCF